MSLSESLARDLQSKPWRAFLRDNPGIGPLVEAYLSGGPRPDLSRLEPNHYAVARVLAEDERRKQTPPLPPPPPPPAGVEWGIKIENWYTANLGVPHYAPEAARRLGAKVGRLECGPGDDTNSKVDLLTQYGVRAQPLFNTHGRVPSSSEVQTLGAMADGWRPRGVKLVEFLNETSGTWYFPGDSYGSSAYRARARDYALKAKQASQILASRGIGLLIQADEVAPGGVWVDEMFSAVPDLTSYAAGWTVHPYGANSDWFGISRVIRSRDKIAQHGDTTKPWYFTEWGIATANGVAMEDNYGLPVNMTYQQCADFLPQEEARWQSVLGSRLAQVLIYTQFDGSSNTSRESNFGLYEHNSWQEKGAWTAALKQRLSS